MLAAGHGVKLRELVGERRSHRLVHLAQDSGKPRIRAQGAVLRKVARMQDEGRLALVPRASGE